MNFLRKDWFEEYEKGVSIDIKEKWKALSNASVPDLEYILESSAVFSSNIEGNTMDLNSFMNAKSHSGSKPKEYEEIVDLKHAYDFARANKLDEANLLEVHRILSERIVSAGNRGAYRQDKVGVFGAKGLAYLAVEHENVQEEMRKLMSDLQSVESNSLLESLYYASLAHLRFAQIHPFSDGNGRTARLLEKWLLAKLEGENAWRVQSEKYYKENQAEYYRVINLGVNYYELDYSRCVPFLFMFSLAI